MREEMYLQECLSCSHKPAKIRAQDRQNTGGATLAEYEYLADGTKLRALDGGGNGYQYRGSLIYAQTAGQSDSPVITLDCAVTSAGRIARETSAAGTVSYRPLIHLRDHLGSVRSVIDGDTGAVVETNDYYPFGKRITPPPVAEPVEATSQSATSPNRWLFSGKESQSLLNASIPFLDFGARMYNPAIARWTAADPLSEKYYGTSPYDYCIGNPIINVDLDGQEIRFFEVSQYLGKTPQYQYSKTVEDANSGEYSVMAYYDENDNIVGYGASRNGRSEYVMDESDDISTFFKKLPNYSVAADFFYKNGTPSEGVIAMAAGEISKGLAIQWHEAIKNPSYYLYAINVLLVSSPSSNNLIEKARLLYPKKANKFEYHHIDPKYMGGNPYGPMVRIEDSYHQMITNEFRRLHPYNKGKLPLEQRKQIMKSVYRKYPIK